MAQTARGRGDSGRSKEAHPGTHQQVVPSELERSTARSRTYSALPLLSARAVGACSEINWGLSPSDSPRNSMEGVNTSVPFPTIECVNEDCY